MKTVTKPIQTVSKRDLLLALKLLENHNSSKVLELKVKEDAAEEAMGCFRATDRQYKELAEAEETAQRARWKQEQKEYAVLQKQLVKCRAAIYTRGPTPKVIQMVEDLIKSME